MVECSMNELKSRFQGKTEALVVAILLIIYVPLIIWLASFLGYSAEAPFIGHLDKNLQLLCAGLIVVALILGVLRPLMKMVLYVKS